MDTRYVEAGDLSAFTQAISPKTRIIWVEMPTNPLLKLVDIAALATLANRHKLWLVVDNTFASPYLQQPLKLGAHVVVHSTTKYLGGHSDAVGGAFITSDSTIFETVKYYQNAAGAVPGPWDSWRVLRGLMTLKVRVTEQSATALHLAQGLEKHPAVERLVARLKLFVLAESLGGVESLLCYPPRMTHAAIGPEERARRGIHDNLVRLSVGLENAADLEADLVAALKD